MNNGEDGEGGEVEKEGRNQMLDWSYLPAKGSLMRIFLGALFFSFFSFSEPVEALFCFALQKHRYCS